MFLTCCKTIQAHGKRFSTTRNWTIRKTKARTAKENSMYHFLMVLHADDFVGSWACKPKDQRFRRSLNKLPGKLHVACMDDGAKFCRCCDMPVSIQDMVTPNQLYVMLPKERVFVPSKKFDYEYLKSQVQELVELFRTLGANQVQYEVSQTAAHDSSLGFNAGVTLQEAGIRAGADMSIEHSDDANNNINGSISYSQQGNEVARYRNDVGRFLRDSPAFYLKTHHDWQSMVTQRLCGHASQLRFSFSYHQAIRYSAHLATQLHRIDASFKRSSSSSSGFTIEFQVGFLDIPDAPAGELESLQDLCESATATTESVELQIATE